jgi:hypothetical protein
MASKIQKYSKPTIVLPVISMADTETAEGRQQTNIRSDEIHPSVLYGSLFPIVQINGKIFDPPEILKFELDCNGEIPRIYLVLRCYNNYFISKKFPRDGATVSIFISSKDNSFTPIRNDYLITSITSDDNKGNDEGILSTMHVSGVLDLPLWSGEQNQAVLGDSFTAMKKIASDLKLGFASNISTASDSMNWVCPYDTYEKWMHDITRSSYNGENSFFKSFIDQYYYLNFVDMNLPFSEELTLDQGLLVDATNNTYDAKTLSTKIQGGILLTNFQWFVNSNFHIQTYNVINNTGSTSLSDGYIRVLQFYDRDTNKKWELPIETMVTKGNEQLDTMQGRTDTEKTQKTKYTWLGLSDTDNVHENYVWSQVNNFQNNRHINKMQLKVELDTPNFNLYRGMRVPVLLTYSNDEAKIASEKATNETAPITYDKFLSGYYVIGGMKYMFNNSTSKFTQEITLCRREWPKVASTDNTNTTFQAPTPTT